MDRAGSCETSTLLLGLEQGRCMVFRDHRLRPPRRLGTAALVNLYRLKRLLEVRKRLQFGDSARQWRRTVIFFIPGLLPLEAIGVMLHFIHKLNCLGGFRLGQLLSFLLLFLGCVVGLWIVRRRSLFDHFVMSVLRCPSVDQPDLTKVAQEIGPHHVMLNKRGVRNN